MKSFIKLYSNNNNEIKRFLELFYLNTMAKNIFHSSINKNTLEYTIHFDNPVIMSDIIACYIDNKDDFKINMWLCIDQGILINVTNNNADEIIRYLFERFPY